VKELTVTVHTKLATPRSAPTLASGKAVRREDARGGAETRFTLDLDVADAIVVR
jgi:hypothetical protein